MTINSLQLVVVNPALDTIEVIADALKVEVEKLFAFATTADGARPPTEVPFAQDGVSVQPDHIERGNNAWEHSVH